MLHGHWFATNRPHRAARCSLNILCPSNRTRERTTSECALQPASTASRAHSERGKHESSVRSLASRVNHAASLRCEPSCAHVATMAIAREPLGFIMSCKWRSEARCHRDDERALASSVATRRRAATTRLRSKRCYPRPVLQKEGFSETVRSGQPRHHFIHPLYGYDFSLANGFRSRQIRGPMTCLKEMESPLN